MAENATRTPLEPETPAQPEPAAPPVDRLGPPADPLPVRPAGWWLASRWPSAAEELTPPAPEAR